MKIKRISLILTVMLMIAATLGMTVSAATLKNGSKGTEVRYLQMNLNGLGYDCGDADGSYGSKTKKAVTAFQKANGLEADGIAGSKTLSKIEGIVKDVQNKLNSAGYNCGTADGVMGTKTTDAIKKFQKDCGLTQSGVADSVTIKKLTDAVNKPKATAKPSATPVPQIFTVTYNCNGGSGVNTTSTFEGGNGHKVISDKPVRDGYVFKGWSLTKDGGVQYKAGEKYTVKKDATLYAVWEKAAATAKPTATPKATAKPQTTAKPTPKIDGSADSLFFDSSKKTVNSWYKVVEESTDKGTPVRTVPREGDNIVKHAKIGDCFYVIYSGKNTKDNLWYFTDEGNYIYSGRVEKVDSVALNYNANASNAKDMPPKETAPKGGTRYITAQNPTRDGYVFVGWSTNKKATKANYVQGDKISISKDTTLYAVWDVEYPPVDAGVLTFSLKKDGEKNLSKNFKVKEFKCSDGSDEILVDMQLVYWLQQIRDHYDTTVVITSAYRTPEKNASLSGQGSSKKSKHLTGQAVDFYVKGHTAREVAQYCESNLPNVQGIELNEKSKYVHIDTRGKKYFFVPVRKNGKITGYKEVKTFY